MRISSLVAVLLVLPALALGLPHPQAVGKNDIRDGKPGVKARFDGQQVVSLTTGGRIPESVHDRVRQLQLDVWKETATELHVRVDPAERAALAALPNAKLATIVEDVQKLIDAERPRGSRSRLVAERYGSPSWFDSYHEYAELTAWYYDLAKKHPDIVAEPQVIGTTIEKRPLLKLTITGPGDASKRKRIWLEAMQHAREWISAATLQYFVDALVNGYVDGDARVRALLSQVEFVVVPVCNPDGYAYTWQSNRLWRKNREAIQNGRTYGVDINRNWPDHWGGRGSSSSPSAEDYRGPSAGSTREVQALMAAYVQTPNIVSAVDLHSYSQLILRPYGWTRDPAPDETRLAAVGKQLADDIRAQSGKEYTSQKSIDLYMTTGDVTAWWYGEALAQKRKAGVPAPRPYSYCIELRPSNAFGGQGFILPPDQIIPTGKEIYAALLHFSEETSSNPLPSAAA